MELKGQRVKMLRRKKTVGRVVLSSTSAGRIRREFPGILLVLNYCQVSGLSACQCGNLLLLIFIGEK